MELKTAWVCGGIGFFMVAGFIGAAIYDVPAPKIKYTLQDLEVPEEVAASYDTLMRYRAGGTNQLEVALPNTTLQLAGTWNNLLPHANAINHAWVNCAEGRQYIHDLDQFPYITDWDNPRKQLNPSTYAIPDFQSMRYITLLYGLHATLLAQQQRPDEGAEELTQHYSVIRKSLPYSTTLVTFVVNLACAKLDMQVADLMVRNTACSPAELRRLKEHFRPLNKEEFSWFRPLLAEYASSQYMVSTIQNDDANPVLDSAVLGRIAFSKNLLFKPNLTMRSFKQIYEPLIDACFQRKDLRPLMQDIQKTVRNNSIDSKLWNPAGQDLVSTMVPIWQNVYDKTLELKTMSDLLAMEIHRKLGMHMELKDVYTGAEYQFDKNRQCFYCLGPDGIDGTSDDIYINKPTSQPDPTLQIDDV